MVPCQVHGLLHSGRQRLAFGLGQQQQQEQGDPGHGGKEQERDWRLPGPEGPDGQPAHFLGAHHTMPNISAPD